MGAPHVFVWLAVNSHVFIWMLSYVHVDECSFTCILTEGAHLCTSTRWRRVLVEWACPWEGEVSCTRGRAPLLRDNFPSTGTILLTEGRAPSSMTRRLLEGRNLSHKSTPIAEKHAHSLKEVPLQRCHTSSDKDTPTPTRIRGRMSTLSPGRTRP